MNSKEEIRSKLQELKFEKGFEWVNELVSEIESLLDYLIDEDDCVSDLDDIHTSEIINRLETEGFTVLDSNKGNSYLSENPLKGADTMVNSMKIDAINEVGIDSIKLEDLEKFLKAYEH